MSENDELTTEDVTRILDTDRLLPEETHYRLAAWVRSEPTFADQVHQVEILAADAGYADDLSAGLRLNEEFDRLLEKTWDHPVTVLEPDNIEADVKFAEFIAIAEARAGRADDPQLLLAIKTRLEKLQALDQKAMRLADDFEDLPTIIRRRHLWEFEGAVPKGLRTADD